MSESSLNLKIGDVLEWESVIFGCGHFDPNDYCKCTFTVDEIDEVNEKAKGRYILKGEQNYVNSIVSFPISHLKNKDKKG